jgi:hypothetical protein
MIAAGGMSLTQAGRVLIAKDNFEPAVGRHEHEAGGNQGPEAQHREDQRRRPMDDASVA